MIGDYEDGMRSLKGAEELRKRTKKKKKNWRSSNFKAHWKICGHSPLDGREVPKLLRLEMAELPGKQKQPFGHR